MRFIEHNPVQNASFAQSKNPAHHIIVLQVLWTDQYNVPGPGLFLLQGVKVDNVYPSLQKTRFCLAQQSTKRCNPQRTPLLIKNRAHHNCSFPTASCKNDSKISSILRNCFHCLSLQFGSKLTTWLLKTSPQSFQRIKSRQY